MREEADKLAFLLRCESYTAESRTPSEKQQILARWIEAAARPYIVATTALAEGFDYPHIRFVVNVNEPESLVTFAQESGRAGRDGSKAYLLVILPPTWEPQHEAAAIGQLNASSRHDLSLRKHRDRQAVH